MPKEKVKRIDSLRHNEYYGMQNTFDELYSESIKEANGGSKIPGTDGLSVKDIAKMKPQQVVEKVRFILRGSRHGYNVDHSKLIKQIWSLGI